MNRTDHPMQAQGENDSKGVTPQSTAPINAAASSNASGDAHAPQVGKPSDAAGDPSTKD